MRREEEENYCAAYSKWQTASDSVVFMCSLAKTTNFLLKKLILGKKKDTLEAQRFSLHCVMDCKYAQLTLWSILKVSLCVLGWEFSPKGFSLQPALQYCICCGLGWTMPNMSTCCNKEWTEGYCSVWFSFHFALDDICLVANFSWHGYDTVSIFCFHAIRICL